MPTPDKQLVERLTHSEVYRTYEAAFRAATGLPLAFAPVETWGLPLHGDENESPLCRILARTSKTCAACLRTQQSLREQAVANGVATVTCFSGLRDSAVPVKLGDRLLGFLHTGQVFTEAPTESDFRQTVETLAGWGAAVDVAALRRSYFACKVVIPERYQAILRLLELFADQLAALCNQILVTEASSENPQIARAREFIAEKLGEDIDLADCAQVAHMSPFYFCKMFKRDTGLSFTDYVSRLRTEKAKSLLLDPNVRVSEAAFDVGFQSLSQFNRVFKKVTGYSPTDYRRRLPATAAPIVRPSHGFEKIHGGFASESRRRNAPPVSVARREQFILEPV